MDHVRLARLGRREGPVHQRQPTRRSYVLGIEWRQTSGSGWNRRRRPGRARTRRWYGARPTRELPRVRTKQVGEFEERHAQRVGVANADTEFKNFRLFQRLELDRVRLRGRRAEKGLVAHKRF